MSKLFAGGLFRRTRKSILRSSQPLRVPISVIETLTILGMLEFGHRQFVGAVRRLEVVREHAESERADSGSVRGDAG